MTLTGKTALVGVGSVASGSPATGPLTGAGYRWTPRVVAQLAVLAAAAYVYAVAEMAPIGAMPAIAADLHVTESRVGMLIAAYAFISVVATVPLVRWTSRWPRRRVLVVTLACLTVSQVLSVLAPGLVLLGASRVLCALTHGLMWAIIAPIAVRLVPSTHAVRATTAVYVGTAAAMILGNPLTTSMSQAWGWRATVAVLAVAAAVITVAAQTILPAMVVAPAVSAPVTKVRPCRNAALVILCAVTLIGVTAHFVSYTFIVPIVRDIVGIHGSREAWVLAAYGIAGLVAMTLLARATDHHLRAVIASGLAALCLVLSMLTALIVAGASVTTTILGLGAIVVWGAAATIMPPILQSAAIRTSAGSAEHASALYVTTFQVGIMAGSITGGLIYEHRAIAPVVAASSVLFAIAFVVALLRDDVFRSAD